MVFLKYPVGEKANKRLSNAILIAAGAFFLGTDNLRSINSE